MSTSRVECYSSSSYARWPVRIEWAGQLLKVAGLLNEWRTPQGKGFLVRVEGGRCFECLYDEHLLCWRVTER